jgi:hypothetical protein
MLRANAFLLLSAIAAAAPAGCSPEDYQCMGGTSPCVLLNEAACTADSNGHCSLGPSCEAACLGTDPSACETGDGAKLCYLAYNKQCVPRDGNPCLALDETQCGASAGCRWANACHGDLPCSSLLSETQCNRRLQCSWQAVSL